MIVALFAVDKAGGMGYRGRLPWPSNPDDMKWFKKTTQDQVVVMGRTTWESPDMPKPLPGRANVVFTSKFMQRDDIEQFSGHVCEALTAIQQAYISKTIYVIGGPNLLLQARPVVERALITRFDQEYLSDTKIDVDFFTQKMKHVGVIHAGSCAIHDYKK